MVKKHKIEIDIESIVEFDMTEKERLDLVKHILYSCTTDKALNKFTREFIKDIAEVERESKNRSVIINACNSLERWLII
jgi:hypothetical protein